MRLSELARKFVRVGGQGSNNDVNQDAVPDDSRGTYELNQATAVAEIAEDTHTSPHAASPVVGHARGRIRRPRQSLSQHRRIAYGIPDGSPARRPTRFVDDGGFDCLAPPQTASRSASSPGWVGLPGSSSDRFAVCIVAGLAPGRIRLRHCSEKLPRVVVSRLAEYLLAITLFDDRTTAHHGYPMCEVLDH
jgi:hypothetical protein